MATLRTPTTNQATTGTAVSVARPTSTTVGDIVIVVVHGNGQITITDNNGSTPFTKDLSDYKPNTGSGHTVSVFSRVIQSGDPSTYNFTLSSSGRWAVIANTVVGGDTSVIYDITPDTSRSAGNESASSINAPTITTATDNAIHFAVGAVDSETATVSSTPATYSATSIAGAGQGLSVATKTITPAGATGAQSFSFSQTTGVISTSFAVKNASAGASVIKSINGIVIASVKSINGIAIASVKSVNGVSNV